MPPASPLSAERVERIGLATGRTGTDATIDAMARAALGQYGAGSARIRNLALDIIHDANVRERDKRGEIDAIHRWVQSHLRYVNDPTWYEFVTYPETLAFERPDGDCDDHSVLEAALLGSIGLPTRFVTFAFRGNAAPSHVALQVLAPGDGGAKPSWLPLDPIVKDQPAGWEAPDFTTRTVYGVNTPKGYARTQSSRLLTVIALALVVMTFGAKFARSIRSLA